MLLVGLAQFLVGVATHAAFTHFAVFGAVFTSMITFRAETPAVGLGHLVTALVEEVHVIDLLDGAAGKAGLVLDQVLEVGLGGDHVVASHLLMPGPVGARPHGVHAGQAAHIA
ncbi:hypothetical protein D3C72_2207150 [compost metagenome]